MKAQAIQAKTSRQTYAVGNSATAGPKGTSLAPPGYGVDFVDRQSELANRARPTAPQLGSQPVQTKLVIGLPGDKYEQEADRVSSQVVKRIQRPVPVRPAQQLTIQHPREGIGAAKATPDITTLRTLDQLQAKTSGEGQRRCEAVGGGVASMDLESAIHDGKGSGQPLDTNLQRAMGQAMGADFRGVRIHADAGADRLNQSIQARAFTAGQDVFFRQGLYQPRSWAGQELIAHELTHVVQQNGRGVRRSAEADGLGGPPKKDVGDAARISPCGESPGRIQRDIGFEFETQGMLTKKSNTGPLPAAGFPNPGAANLVFNAVTSTRVDKGAVLLKRADIEVQGDDCPMGSDLEVVTTHFPLTAGGRLRLNNAMADLNLLINAYTPLANASGQIVPALALDNTAGFRTKMRDGMMLGGFAAATTAPQVTFGIRAGNIGNIVRELHADPHEAAIDKTARDPGRLRLRRPDLLVPNDPRALNPNEEASTLIDGHALAGNAIAAYQLIDVLAPGGPELEGLLTIIFTYCESMQHKGAFLKNHTPLMAKTDLATIFWMLPGPVRTYYSQIDHTGKSNLEKLVEAAVGYPAKMNQPLFAGVDGLAEDDQPMGMAQWYHALTLESWLRGIILRDRTRGEAVSQFFNDKFGGSTKRPGTDQLTNASFPGKPVGQEVEGYGALGKRMDRDVTHPATRLPIFELRSGNRMITYGAAQQWALDLFDYIQSLNANPGGGHNLIV